MRSVRLKELPTLAAQLRVSTGVRYETANGSAEFSSGGGVALCTADVTGTCRIEAKRFAYTVSVKVTALGSTPTVDFTFHAETESGDYVLRGAGRRELGGLSIPEAPALEMFVQHRDSAHYLNAVAFVAAVMLLIW